MGSQATMSAELAQLLKQHAPHFAMTEEGKVKCELNGHCFPPRAEVVAAFANGSKYAKLVKRYQDEQYLKKLEPFLVPSRNFAEMLFCALTGQLINRTAVAAKTHMQGKRFKRAKDRFMSDEQDLFEEPPMEGDAEPGPSTAAGADGAGADANAGADAAAGGGDVAGDAADEDGMGIWIPDAAMDSDDDAEAGASDGESGSGEEGAGEGGAGGGGGGGRMDTATTAAAAAANGGGARKGRVKRGGGGGEREALEGMDVDGAPAEEAAPTRTKAKKKAQPKAKRKKVA